jgi:hypothetical protein
MAFKTVAITAPLFCQNRTNCLKSSTIDSFQFDMIENLSDSESTLALPCHQCMKERSQLAGTFGLPVSLLDITIKFQYDTLVNLLGYSCDQV